MLVGIKFLSGEAEPHWHPQCYGPVCHKGSEMGPKEKVGISAYWGWGGSQVCKKKPTHLFKKKKKKKDDQACPQASQKGLNMLWSFEDWRNFNVCWRVGYETEGQKLELLELQPDQLNIHYNVILWPTAANGIETWDYVCHWTQVDETPCLLGWSTTATELCGSFPFRDEKCKEFYISCYIYS